MESQILTEVTLRLRYIQIEEFITSEYFRARKTYKTIFFLQYSLSPQINSTIIRTSKPQKHYQKCTDIMARISAFFFLCDGSHIWCVRSKVTGVTLRIHTGRSRRLPHRKQQCEQSINRAARSKAKYS